MSRAIKPRWRSGTIEIWGPRPVSVKVVCLRQISRREIKSMNTETKTCQSCKKPFVIEPDDFDFYTKIKVPPPTWCPECRMIRRFVWRNEHHLFRRPDANTNKEVFSSLHPAAPLKTYELAFWDSDQWDPMQHGRDYDLSRPFFEQFRELLYAVPWPARSVINGVNSEYSDKASNIKNCYLCFNVTGGENCAYGIGMVGTKDSVDLYQARHSELCYDDFMADEAYRVFFSVNVEDSTDIWFSRNLIGCNNCFGCVNLRNKSYHIFNKPYSKESYREYIAKLQSGSHSAVTKLKKEAQEFWRKNPMRFTLAINVVNSTGEHIEHSKNLQQCFNVHEAENLKYCQFLDGPVTDSYDYSVWGAGASLMYEAMECGIECAELKFVMNTYPSSEALEYCNICRSSSDLFGCVGLHKKQYCILNKQYSKEEYFKLREKIIAHMQEMPYTDKQGRVYRYGEFFPPEFSPFAYNETIAQDFFPLTKAEAEKKGYLWREPERREYEATVKTVDLPDDIKDVQDDILKAIIACSDCGKPYRIIEMELQFLRRIPLPLPHKCPECRFKDRFTFVNPPKFWPAKCQCAGKTDDRKLYTNQNGGHAHGAEHCANVFETSYAPERPDIIYCESCYNAEVA